METFGCCSHFIQCSDCGNCLFIGNEEYEGCQYRKNLDAGRIFYGTRAGEIVLENTEIVLVNTEIVQKKQLPEHIYISCYERYFRIGHLGRNGFSYPLKDEEKELLIEKLKALDIPYAMDDDETKCIVDGDADEPANSKVYFSFEEKGQRFSIANYNAYLIRKRYADGIAKSLSKKGIKAETQLIGAYSGKTDYVRNKVVTTVEKKEENAINELKLPEKQVYKQISFFDMLGA